MNASLLVKSSTGNYQVRSLQVGDHIQIHPENLSKSRQYLANATGEIIAIKGNKASVLLDKPNKRRTVKIDLCLLRLTSAQEWEQDSQLQESLQEDSSCEDFAKLTLSAVTDSLIASPMSPSTPTCENFGLDQERQISSQLRHHAPHSQLKANVWEVLTQETASPQSYDKSEEFSPSSQSSKTCLDCYQPPLFPETNPAHISNRCSGSFGQAGTMRNGLLSEHKNTTPSGQEKGSCLLPRPGALSKSSESSRPPGNTKSEAAAKKLGIIQKNEVFNPDWLELQFGLPQGWTSPQEHRAATALLVPVEPPSEIVLTPDLQRSPSVASSTSTPSSFKAISLWQPWASLIPLGLKHYETRSWKTSYRGKLLICSAVKFTKAQYQQYLKICNEVELPPWNKTNFPQGLAIAICDLVDCIEMTAEFIEQQSTTEILCGDWQVGRYAWKLQNIQPITEPFAVKGKQGLFNIPLTTFESALELTELLKPRTADRFKTCPSCGESLLNLADGCGVCGWVQLPTAFLGDKLDEQISPRKSKSEPEFLGDKLELKISPRKIEGELLLGEKDSIYEQPSTEDESFLGDNPNSEISPRKTRRRKGDGSGSIHWRTVTKNGKDYREAYYHYEFWNQGDRLIKSTKYIPKRLLTRVQELEQDKAPVREILLVLGVVE